MHMLVPNLKLWLIKIIEARVLARQLPILLPRSKFVIMIQRRPSHLFRHEAELVVFTSVGIGGILQHRSTASTFQFSPRRRVRWFLRIFTRQHIELIYYLINYFISIYLKYLKNFVS